LNRTRLTAAYYMLQVIILIYICYIDILDVRITVSKEGDVFMLSCNKVLIGLGSVGFPSL